jgi:hypothetical protein
MQVDVPARANNAQADLYQALKTWADAGNDQELITTLNVDYLTVDRIGLYRHPIAGNRQVGMVVHFDRDERDRAMRKAALFGGMAKEASDLYFDLYAPSPSLLLAARALMKDIYQDTWPALRPTDMEELCNLINF